MATRGVKRELIPTKHKQFVFLYLYVFLCGQLKTTEEDRSRCFGLMSDSVSVSRKLLESAGSGGDSTELKTGYIFTFAWRNEPLRCKQSTGTSCNSLIWLLNGGKCTEKRRGERKDPAGLQRETVSELIYDQGVLFWCPSCVWLLCSVQLEGATVKNRLLTVWWRLSPPSAVTHLQIRPC